MRKEFSTRPTFDLAGQLKIMDRSKGVSDVDNWFTSMAGFMRTTGAVTDVPDAKAYITDEFMKMVNADKTLREFANKPN